MSHFIEPTLQKKSILASQMQYAFDNSNDLSNFQISEDSIFAARVCSIFELPHESGVQISKLYIEWQA